MIIIWFNEILIILRLDGDCKGNFWKWQTTSEKSRLKIYIYRDNIANAVLKGFVISVPDPALRFRLRLNGFRLYRRIKTAKKLAFLYFSFFLSKRDPKEILRLSLGLPKICWNFSSLSNLCQSYNIQSDAWVYRGISIDD